MKHEAHKQETRKSRRTMIVSTGYKAKQDLDEGNADGTKVNNGYKRGLLSCHTAVALCAPALCSSAISSADQLSSIWPDNQLCNICKHLYSFGAVIPHIVCRGARMVGLPCITPSPHSLAAHNATHHPVDATKYFRCGASVGACLDGSCQACCEDICRDVWGLRQQLVGAAGSQQDAITEPILRAAVVRGPCIP